MTLIGQQLVISFFEFCDSAAPRGLLLKLSLYMYILSYEICLKGPMALPLSGSTFQVPLLVKLVLLPKVNLQVHGKVHQNYFINPSIITDYKNPS